MRKFIIVLCALLGVGCGTFQTHEAAWRLGVTYAIQRYIYERPEDAREATKARIRAIVDELSAITTGDAVTLPLLRSALAMQLDRANLIPPDRALIEGIADVVVAELGKRVGDRVIPADQIFEVIQVLELVRRAAEASV